MKNICVKVSLFFAIFQSFCAIEDDLYQMYHAIIACRVPDRDRATITEFRAQAAKKKRAKQRHTSLYGHLSGLCDKKLDFLSAMDTLREASWDDKAGLMLVIQVAHGRVQLAQQEVEDKFNKSFRSAQRLPNVRMWLRSKTKN